MNMTFSGGSYGGDDSKINDESVLECKICWHIYDPKEGDPVWQIPPGTPFSQLPDHWTCPNCDGAKDDFMVVDQ
ncbi:rubredoxin [uncultured Cohaesibacter sp.]|uniref:rubredoxin n=1 Tax=uncultured Cohaesibacter sp. TaxID=1002546 RepID=UPI0029C70262|nr:rubredoxin [uncultured Cohaesibacter sp.]